MGLVQKIETIKRKVATASAIVGEIQAFGERPVAINLWPTVEEIGNLNYDAFKEIAEFLGIITTPYETKRHFIDEALLRKRNKIAHGERLDVDVDAVETAFGEVNGLMRSFKTDIENSVSAKDYRAQHFLRFKRAGFCGGFCVSG